MEFFKHNTQIDFMAQRKWAALFSIVIFIASAISLGVNGLTWGLDFTGGVQIEMHYQKPADLTQVRQQLKEASIKNAVVTNFGTAKDVLISLPVVKVTNAKQRSTKLLRDATANRVAKALPKATIQRVDFIGSQVGSELASKGALAIIVSLIATMIYIAFRFEMRFAVSSAIALIHDPILILGMFSYFHIEFDLVALAALLTVIGYSLNDTVVVFDRVRENFIKLRKDTPKQVLNKSINQTLSRTIMTSFLTLLVVIALYFFGGPTVHGFALALIIGIVIGTYSSIYVAGSLALYFGMTRQHLLPAAKETLDDRP